MPLCFELLGQNCRLVIAGGGRQALQKARAFLGEGAAVTACAPAFRPELEALAKAHPCPAAAPAAPGRLRLVEGPLTPALLKEATLLFAATGSKEGDRSALLLARCQGLPAFAATAQPAAFGRFMKAEGRGGLTLACSTGGSYPALCRPLLAALWPAADPFAARLPFLKTLRPRLKALLPPEQSRAALRALAAQSPEALARLAALPDTELARALGIL